MAYSPYGLQGMRGMRPQMGGMNQYGMRGQQQQQQQMGGMPGGSSYINAQRTPPGMMPGQAITSCPSPKEHIQLANNDWILAGELKVGDEVITSKDPQKVTFAKTIEDSPRREVLFTEGDSIVTSPSHPYFVNSKGFVDVEDLKEGDEIGDLIVSEVKPFSDGPVIHISVDKAQTYMLRGGTEENPVPALSHNKMPMQEPPPPRPGDPGYEEWRVTNDARLGRMWTDNPPSPDNQGSWTAYQKWLERGNTPIPGVGTQPMPQPGLYPEPPPMSPEQEALLERKISGFSPSKQEMIRIMQLPENEREDALRAKKIRDRLAEKEQIGGGGQILPPSIMPTPRVPAPMPQVPTPMPRLPTPGPRVPTPPKVLPGPRPPSIGPISPPTRPPQPIRSTPTPIRPPQAPIRPMPQPIGPRPFDPNVGQPPPMRPPVMPQPGLFPMPEPRFLKRPPTPPRGIRAIPRPGARRRLGGGRGEP